MMSLLLLDLLGFLVLLLMIVKEVFVKIGLRQKSFSTHYPESNYNNPHTIPGFFDSFSIQGDQDKDGDL